MEEEVEDVDAGGEKDHYHQGAGTTVETKVKAGLVTVGNSI